MTVSQSASETVGRNKNRSETFVTRCRFDSTRGTRKPWKDIIIVTFRSKH